MVLLVYTQIVETVHSNYIINCVNDYKDEVTYMNEKTNLFFPGSYQFSFYEGSDFFATLIACCPSIGGYMWVFLTSMF